MNDKNNVPILLKSLIILKCVFCAVLIFTIPILVIAQSGSKKYIEEKAVKKIIGPFRYTTKEICKQGKVGNCFNEVSTCRFGDNCEHEYRGQFEKGRVTHGKYIWDYGNGKSSYEGDLKEGKPHGKGTMIKEDGTKLQSNFKNGNVFGYAKITHSDGSIEEGSFNENGHLEGEGEFTWGRGRYAGSKYFGNFKEGKFHGFGEIEFIINKKISIDNTSSSNFSGCEINWLSYGTNEKYVGEWEDCNFKGYGVYYGNNIIDSGEWNDNEFWIFPEEFVLDILNNKYHKNYIPLTPIRDNEEEEHEQQEMSDLQNGFDRINEKFATDTTPNITTTVRFIDTVNAFGHRELLLKIKWDIDTIRKGLAGFKEDIIGNYKSGSYLYDEASNVKALLRAIEAGITSNNTIKRYINKSDRIHITILASADKPLPNQKYKGEYGYDISGAYSLLTANNTELTGTPERVKGLRKGVVINKNETLAYIRAFGAKDYFRENIKDLPDEKSGRIHYNLRAIAYKEKGDQYRKLTIEMTIKIPIIEYPTVGKPCDTIEFYENIPDGYADDNAIAFIISNHNYTHPMLKNMSTGKKDSELIRNYFEKSFDIDNIHYDTNLTVTKLKNYFLMGKFEDYIDANLSSYEEPPHIVFYISAFGSITNKNKPVILGTDAEYPSNGVLLDSIYSVVSRLDEKYKSTLMLFDVSYTDFPNTIVPLTIDMEYEPKYWTNKTVCIHASNSGISYMYPSKKLSLFSYFFCKSIYDKRSQNMLTIREVFNSIEDNIPNQSNLINKNFYQMPIVFPENTPENRILDRVLIKYQ